MTDLDRPGVHPRVWRTLLVPLMVLGVSGTGVAAGDSTDCGAPGTLAGKRAEGSVALPTRVFPDGSIAVRAPLAVNPDGSAASYTVGDHGYTYIANGLALWVDGKRKPCDSACRTRFLAAEAAGFAAGTAEFCVFAMEVEPIAAGGKVTSCKDGHVVGNGKGALRRGASMPSVGGGSVVPYVSMTTLRHRVGGELRYLDASAIPVAVSPRSDLIGRVVWVGGAGFRDTFALIGDKGPAFGEGSVALHQLLRYGELKVQAPGPIPAANRCQSAERDLPKPFVSKPAGGHKDRCRPGHVATSDSDIRAYGGIEGTLDFVILGKAAFVRKGGAIPEEVSTASIAAKAAGAGYTPEAIAAMVACLPK